jgi:hypothetical protein
VESGYSELEICVKTGSLYPRFTKKENKISHVDYTSNILCMYFIRLHLVEVSLFSCVFINYVVKKHICYVCTLCIINYLK